MAIGSEIFWRGIPAVRRRERARFLFFAGLFALISFAQTVGLAGSEALFLVQLGPERLPLGFVLASAVTVLGSLAYALVVGGARNDRLFAGMLFFAAAILGGGCALLWLGVSWTPLALFCAFYLFQAVFINLHFWTFAADFFDTLSSKRLFPGFVLGSSAGGMAGGLAAVGLSRWLPSESLIACWALALLCAGALVLGARSNLMRWAPVGGVELDESSVEGVRGALRYLSRSSLSRALVTSVAGMVISLFLIQYLYLQVFAASFEGAAALAAFLGVYLAASNGVEMVVGRGLTPWLIRRFGVARANLAHPALTLLSFAAMAFDPRLHTAILARANRELMENALATPVRALSYNSIPLRFRGRMRAFLEGIVQFAAMSVAGAVLLVLGDRVDPRWLYGAGAASALLYAAANWQVQREYLRSLVSELRRGRLDLEGVAGDLGAAEVSHLAEQWESVLRDEVDHPSTAVLQMAPVLAARDLIDPVVRAADHPHPKVRIACVEALAGRDAPGVAALLVRRLTDPDPGVRLAAVRAAGQLTGAEGADAEALRSAVRDAGEDTNPSVRGEAAVTLGRDGLETLRRMAADPDPAIALEALDRLPDELSDEARARAADEHPGVRAAALASLARNGRRVPIPPEQLISDMKHADSRVRRAAARALGSHGQPAHAEKLAEALDDPAREVRSEATEALAALGDAGVRAASPHASGPRVWTVDAALSTFARAGGDESRRLLEEAFRNQVLDAWKMLLALSVLTLDQSLASRFLHIALGNAAARNHWLAFRTLELLEDPDVVRSVRKCLTFQATGRADALEVLTHLGDRETSQLLALLLEEGSIDEKMSSVSRVLPQPRGVEEVLERARHSPDRWLRIAARSHGAEQTDRTAEDRTMESLLALRNVSLFAHLSLEQLEAIHQLMNESEYIAGEAVVREGEPGEDLYVLLEGEVQFFKSYGSPDQVLLGTSSPVSFFGEISIFDNAPRSATAVISRDARLLSLGGARFKELISQSPELSFQIFRVLTSRIRAAEERLEASEAR